MFIYFPFEIIFPSCGFVFRSVNVTKLSCLILETWDDILNDVKKTYMFRFFWGFLESLYH